MNNQEMRISHETLLNTPLDSEKFKNPISVHFCLIFMAKSRETTHRTNFLAKNAQYNRKLSQNNRDLSLKFLQNQQKKKSTELHTYSF